MPLVSVIINCHNGADYLREALESVRRQTFTDYEIIFWDNQSTDGSGQIARSYGEPLRYFRGEEFLPLGAARNRAIAEASGSYIALLDGDDVWLPEKLARQVALMAADPGLALVYTNACLVNEKGEGKGETHFDRVAPVSGNIFFSLLLKGNPIICSTVMFRRDVFDRLGGFRPELDIVEEYDLFLRMFHQHRASYLELPLAKLRLHAGSYSRKHAIRTSREKIEVTLRAADMLETISRTQARGLKRKFIRQALVFLQAYAMERKYARIPRLIIELSKKYRLLSAELRRKVNRLTGPVEDN